MPTYEYECRNCEYVFEAFQSMSDEPLTQCPKCGGKVRRLIGGGSGIIFKGSGFYSTDSRKSGSAASGIKHPSHKEKASEGGDSSVGATPDAATSAAAAAGGSACPACAADASSKKASA